MECHAGLARKFQNQMRRNQIAKLSENTELWMRLVWYFFFFTSAEWQS